MPIPKGKISLNPVYLATYNYVDWLNDSQVTKYMQAGKKSWSEHTLNEWIYKMNDNPNIILRGIFLDEHLIGAIKMECDWLKREASIGLMIGDKSKWGKGYGTEAIRLMKKEIYGIKRFWTAIHPENIASIKAFEKNGFNEKRIMLICRNEK